MCYSVFSSKHWQRRLRSKTLQTFITAIHRVYQWSQEKSCSYHGQNGKIFERGKFRVTKWSAVVSI